MALQGSLLLSGHANGDVTFWELRRTAWEPVKVLTGVHDALHSLHASPAWPENELQQTHHALNRLARACACSPLHSVSC